MYKFIDTFAFGFCLIVLYLYLPLHLVFVLDILVFDSPLHLVHLVFVRNIFFFGFSFWVCISQYFKFSRIWICNFCQDQNCFNLFNGGTFQINI